MLLRQDISFASGARLLSQRSARRALSATSQQATAQTVAFPKDYTQLIRQAQGAVQQALEDGKKLIEIEFPTNGLQSVPGDGEGANEMTQSLQFLRQFCIAFQANASSTRIFFPDQQELELAKSGLEAAPSSGTAGFAPVFDASAFQLDYLTRPTGLLDLGIDLNKVEVGERLQPGDELVMVAYPHFNVNEMIAVAELWERAARARGLPIVVFNGELDRIRTGYYPALFYPKIGRIAQSFIPHFETTYYIHNFKGSRGGVLFRCYPGPWQVFRRDSSSNAEVVQLVHTQESMPTLKEVALDILPKYQ